MALTPSGDAPAVAGTAAVHVQPPPAVRAVVSPALLQIDLEAAPGTTAYLFLGFPLQPGVALPIGEFWIGPVNVLLDATVIPASGAHQVMLALPPLPPGIPLLLQSIVMPTGSPLRLSNPVMVTLDR